MASELTTAMADLEEMKVQELVKQGWRARCPASCWTMCEGMSLIGKRFESGAPLRPIMAGEIFKTAAADLTALGGSSGPSKGKVVMGTVKGDIHDIGKDIVVTMLRGANYEVTDLGVDVPPAKFVEAVKETGATVVGMSGLLTISFDPMKESPRRPPGCRCHHRADR
jgi:5-methyltetrahydrofolate--homocysteine methyltransferase